VPERRLRLPLALTACACAPSETWCEGSTARACTGDARQILAPEDCPLGCADGACVLCAVGETSCDGKKRHTCRADRKDFEIVGDCCNRDGDCDKGFVCQSEVCVQSQCYGGSHGPCGEGNVCDPETWRCREGCTDDSGCYRSCAGEGDNCYQLDLCDLETLRCETACKASTCRDRYYCSERNQRCTPGCDSLSEDCDNLNCDWNGSGRDERCDIAHNRCTCTCSKRSDCTYANEDCQGGICVIVPYP